MSDLKDYFRPSTIDPYYHPLLRRVDEAAKRPAVKKIVVEILRPRDVLGFKPAKLYLHLLGEAGQDVEPYQKEDWDDALNTALVQRGILAISPDNEKVRFTLGLRAALQSPETRFGDGYFNAVLVDLIVNSPFASHPSVAPILQFVYKSGVETSSKSYAECRGLIDDAIRGRAMELVKLLGYDIPEAEEILAAAVANYLDGRFSVTNRKIMGLL